MQCNLSPKKSTTTQRLAAQQSDTQRIACELSCNPDYRQVAEITVLKILEIFPARVKSSLLLCLGYLLEAAINYSMQNLTFIIENKLKFKSMDTAQRAYWLVAGVRVAPEEYEEHIWKYVKKTWQQANKVCEIFLKNEFFGATKLSTRVIGKFIELLVPHAELKVLSGVHTYNDAMRRGDNVRYLVNRLSISENADVEPELQRLLGLPELSELKYNLENALHQARLNQRERSFHFSSLADVAGILANKAPANPKDLFELTLAHLDDIAQEIRGKNDNGYQKFWNEKNKQKNGRKHEEFCRDELLTRLESHLNAFGIDCMPEGKYVDNKRADIRLSHGGDKLDLPIEIKCNDNVTLWTNLHKQLIEQYTIEPNTAGFGIYLVLWFGVQRRPPPTDGGKQAQSPEELRQRLEGLLSPELQQRIAVRVLDVSW
jgi:hypothetical protein